MAGGAVLLALLLVLFDGQSAFAAGRDIFIFNGERVVNVRNSHESVRILEKLPIAQLKRRFARYRVVATPGEDCNICAIVSGRGASLEIDYDADGIVVVSISSRDKTSTDALAVEPQDVVLGQAESADGCSIIDAGVRPMPVIAMQPDW